MSNRCGVRSQEGADVPDLGWPRPAAGWLASPGAGSEVGPIWDLGAPFVFRPAILLSLRSLAVGDSPHPHSTLPDRRLGSGLATSLGGGLAPPAPESTAGPHGLLKSPRRRAGHYSTESQEPRRNGPSRTQSFAMRCRRASHRAAHTRLSARTAKPPLERAGTSPFQIAGTGGPSTSSRSKSPNATSPKPNFA